MDVLLDTNILIHRESDEVVPESLRELQRALQKAGHRLLVHPLSMEEIRNDPDDTRRKRAESRVETYPTLEFPPTPSGTDAEFRDAVPEGRDFNEQVDNALLFAAYEDAVDFLITEDREMHRKALELDIQDRVFDIEEGKEHFAADHPPVRGPAALQQTTLGELDLTDPIFDPLKEQYAEFTEWANSKADRPAWVNYTEEGHLGALLILKLSETENIGADPPLGRKARLKISTLIVDEARWGSKVGELLISIAIRQAITQGHEEVYLTHYIEEPDYLVDLLETYGFRHESNKPDGEAIFLKQLTPPIGTDVEPVELASTYYPTFYDGSDVNKFVVPIQPKYHNRLFTSYADRQPGISEFAGQFHPEGNAIKKAYLSNSTTRKIEAGDLLLFYRSHDHKRVTSIGVCEEVRYGLTDSDEIQRLVGKRSVFSDSEIRELAESETTVLLFSWHFELPTPVSDDQLYENDVLAGPPQVMQEIDEQGYCYIREQGGIDERFTRH
jgi:GNAT superfamily N-acetyltransferase